MQAAIKETLHPASFIGTQFTCSAAVEHLNAFLSYDGYVVKPSRGVFKVNRIASEQVTVTLRLGGASELNQAYVDDQITKCERKVQDEDFDGAITSARTLLEANLLEIERRIVPDAKPYDGDLVRLYKRVQTVLGLDPGRKGITDTIKHILNSLSGIISGIAGMRNKMSDAHALTYKPARHHAF